MPQSAAFPFFHNTATLQPRTMGGAEHTNRHIKWAPLRIQRPRIAFSSNTEVNYSRNPRILDTYYDYNLPVSPDFRWFMWQQSQKQYAKTTNHALKKAEKFKAYNIHMSGTSYGTHVAELKNKRENNGEIQVLVLANQEYLYGQGLQQRINTNRYLKSPLDLRLQIENERIRSISSHLREYTTSVPPPRKSLYSRHTSTCDASSRGNYTSLDEQSSFLVPYATSM